MSDTPNPSNGGVPSTPATSPSTPAVVTTTADPANGNPQAAAPVQTQDVKQPEVKQPNIKKLKLKIDGKDIDDEFNLDDEQEIIKTRQKAKAFDKRSEELSTYQKQMNALIAKMKEDPLAIYSQLGGDAEKLVAAHVQKVIERESKTPEQLEREKQLQELETLRKEKEELTKKAKEKEISEYSQKFQFELNKHIDEALTSTKSILPKKDPEIMKEIGATMIRAYQRGQALMATDPEGAKALLDVQAKDVIPYIEARYKKNLANIFNNLDEDGIEHLVGNNNIERLRKKKWANIKDAPPSTSQITDTGKIPDDADEKKNKKTISSRKFFSMHGDDE